MNEHWGPVGHVHPHDTTTHMRRLGRPNGNVYRHASKLHVTESPDTRGSDTAPKKRTVRGLPKAVRRLAAAVTIAVSSYTLPACATDPIAPEVIKLHVVDTVPDKRLPEPLSQEYFPIGWDSEYGPIPRFHTKPDPKSPTISFEQFISSYKQPSNSPFVLARLYPGRAHEPDGTLTTALSERVWEKNYNTAGFNDVTNHNIKGKDDKVHGLWFGIEVDLGKGRTTVYIDPRFLLPLG